MRGFIFAGAILTLAAAGPAMAQEAAGDWTGYIDRAEGKVPVVIHIKKTAAGFEVTGDSPAQEAYGLPGALVESGATLKLDFSGIQGFYDAKWDAERKAYVGEWKGADGKYPMVIVKDAPKT